MTMAKGPMQGVRILDLSTIIAGPMATGMLADQGADVIKVEAPPFGDRLRNTGCSRNGVTGTHHMVNRGKRSITLDLKSEAGLRVIRRLIARSDILLHNFRPKVMARLGLSYEDLRKDHPELVYVSISGFGDKGPMADRPAFDHIMQCYAGFADLQGNAKQGQPPSLVRNTLIDKLTAITAAQATAAAMYARATGAGGQEVKLSMLSSAIAFIWPDAATGLHMLDEGAVEMPPVADFCRLYPFKDGYATFSPSAASFAELCREYQAPTGAHPALQSDRGRVIEVELMAQVESEWAEATAKVGVEEGIAFLESIDAPCGKVRSLGDLVDDPQVEANGYLRVADHPVAGRILEAREPAEFSGTPCSNPGPSPALGEHGGDILAELGFSASDAEALRTQGALG